MLKKIVEINRETFTDDKILYEYCQYSKSLNDAGIKNRDESLNQIANSTREECRRAFISKDVSKGTR